MLFNVIRRLFVFYCIAMSSISPKVLNFVCIILVQNKNSSVSLCTMLHYKFHYLTCSVNVIWILAAYPEICHGNFYILDLSIVTSLKNSSELWNFWHSLVRNINKSCLLRGDQKILSGFTMVFYEKIFGRAKLHWNFSTVP